MYTINHLNLLQLILALSEALDLASPLLAKHQLRTAYISWKISEKLNYNHEEVEKIVFAALMHDIGALAPEDKINLHEDEYDKDVEIHCILGEKLLKHVKEFNEIAIIVRHHHKSLDEWGDSLRGRIVEHSNLLYLADTIERAIDRDKPILSQRKSIIDKTKEMKGTVFVKRIVEAFLSLAGNEDFWLDLTLPRLNNLFQTEALFSRSILPQSGFVEFSELIRAIIDFRSPFTSAHSAGVATAAECIAGNIGFSGDEINEIRIAGNLHDIGKLALDRNLLLHP